MNYRVLVCPQCGGTSVGTEAGKWWSRAGACHIGDEAVEPVEYIPAVDAVKALGRIAAGPNDAPFSEPWSKAEATIALKQERGAG